MGRKRRRKNKVKEKNAENKECKKKNIIVLEENNKEFRMIVNKEIRNINCFKPEERFKIPQKQKRCDYIVEIIHEKQLKVLFIELESMNFKEGVEQLEATISFLKGKYSDWKKCCFLIASSINIPQAKTRLQKEKIKFAKNFGATFQPKSKECITTVSDLINCNCK